MSQLKSHLPTRWKALMEMRASFQWGAHALMLPALSLWPKPQERGPVMVLPGMATSDLAMLPMRFALDRLGHHTYEWGQGFNTHPNDHQMDQLVERIFAISKHHSKPVALVGWSLGGAIAKVLAARAPNHIKCVIALASPLATRVSSHLTGIHGFLSGKSIRDAQRDALFKTTLKTVPLSSIASVDDGLLAWQSSVVKPGKKQETILLNEVAHLGFPAHPMVLWLVHNRLQENKEQWRPFSPGSMIERAWLAKQHSKAR